MTLPPRLSREVDEIVKIQDNGGLLELHPLGHASGPGNLAVLVPHGNILFAGEVCSNGPEKRYSKGSQQVLDCTLGQLELLSRSVVPHLATLGAPRFFGGGRTS